MTENLTADLDALARDLDAEHVFHSWSAQGTPPQLVIASGRGTRVWDHAGREYLDFSSQLVNVNIGHQHPAVVATLATLSSLNRMHAATSTPSAAHAETTLDTWWCVVAHMHALATK